ncbi:MAG: 4Fe-4S binding protein, partial [Victivallales bacterium]|nr:4Fe-4S binding protein [Victivallales bacterium]
VSQEDIRFLKGKPSVDMDKCSGCGRCAKNCNSSAISISSISINDSKPKKKAIIDHFMCRQCGKCVDVCKFHAIKRFQQEVQVGTWGLLDLNLSNQTWTKCDNTAPSIGTGRPAVTSVCKQCTLCQVVCPHGAFNQSSGGGKPEIDGTKCVNCKQCLTQCPNGAVQLSANGVEIPFEEPKTPQNMDKEELNFRFAFWLHELCNGCGKCSRTFYCDSFLDRRGLDWQPLMDIRNCTGCGLCVQTCPQGALQLFAPEHYAVLIGEDSNTLMEWHRRLTAHQIPHFVYTKSELEKVANLTGSEIYQLWKQAVKNDKCSEDNQSPVEECPVILINDEKKATLYSPCSKQNKVLAAGALDELLKHERMQAIMAEVHRRLANLRGE